MVRQITRCTTNPVLNSHGLSKISVLILLFSISGNSTVGRDSCRHHPVGRAYRYRQHAKSECQGYSYEHIGGAGSADRRTIGTLPPTPAHRRGAGALYLPARGDGVRRGSWCRRGNEHPRRGGCSHRGSTRTDRRSPAIHGPDGDRKSTRLNSSHVRISYAV